MIELLGKRSHTAKHWLLSEGVYRMDAHIGHIHYQDGPLKDGAFQDIDTTLNYNAGSESFAMTDASYEAEIGLYGDIRFHNVDHSIAFALDNPNRVQATAYDGSLFGKLGKGLIWRDIIQVGGHQIVEARNNSLSKFYRFDVVPDSNIVEFKVVASDGLSFDVEGERLEVAPSMMVARQSMKSSLGLSGPVQDDAVFSVLGHPQSFGTADRTSWLRDPKVWNHRGERADVEVRFIQRDGELWAQKIIPQEFIDATFTEKDAWLEVDTTTSFYARSGDGSGYHSGYASTWASIRAAAASLNDSTNTANIAIYLEAGTTGEDNYWVTMWRSWFPFDTSGLTSGASISAASFNAFVIDKYTDLGNANVALDLWNGSGTYNITGVYSGVRQATDITLTASQYNAWTLNGTGLGNISKTGTTNFALRLAWDLDSSPPTWVAESYSGSQLRFSEYTGTGSDPYLSITYSIPFAFVMTASGGATTGGVGSIANGKVITPSGGAVTGGTATFVFALHTNFVCTPTGGAVTGGTATVVFQLINVYVFVPSGGVTVGGVATLAMGKVFVASGGVIAGGKAYIPPIYWLQFEVGGPGFYVGDILLAQRVDYDAVSAKILTYRVIGEVMSLDAEGEASVRIESGEDYLNDFGDGIEFVRIGSSTNSTRRGSIYMTSDDTHAPYLDVIDGITQYSDLGATATIKARLGNLAGITDPTFGALTGYGLYTQNCYLTGNMKLGSLSSISWNQVTAAGGGRPADNATVGATWTGVGQNITGIPTALKTPSDNSNAAGLYIDINHMGYWAGAAWKTYMDSSGNFYLSGSGSNSLTWNGTNLGIIGVFKTGTSGNYITIGDIGIEIMTFYFGGTGKGQIAADGLGFALSCGSGSMILYGTATSKIELTSTDVLLTGTNIKANTYAVHHAGNTTIGSSSGATGPTLKRTLTINGSTYDLACYT